MSLHERRIEGDGGKKDEVKAKINYRINRIRTSVNVKSSRKFDIGLLPAFT